MEDAWTPLEAPRQRHLIAHCQAPPSYHPLQLVAPAPHTAASSSWAPGQCQIWPLPLASRNVPSAILLFCPLFSPRHSPCSPGPPLLVEDMMPQTLAQQAPGKRVPDSLNLSIHRIQPIWISLIESRPSAQAPSGG